MGIEASIQGKSFKPTSMEVAMSVLLLSPKKEKNYKAQKKEMFLKLTQTITSILQSQNSLNLIPQDPIECLLMISEADKDDLSRDLGFKVYKLESQITFSERQKVTNFLINGVSNTLKEITTSQQRNRRQEYIFMNYFGLAKDTHGINFIIEKTKELLKKYFLSDNELEKGRAQNHVKGNEKEAKIKSILLGIREYWQLPNSKTATTLHIKPRILEEYRRTYKLDKEGNVVRIDGKPLNLGSRH